MNRHFSFGLAATLLSALVASLFNCPLTGAQESDQTPMGAYVKGATLVYVGTYTTSGNSKDPFRLGTLGNNSRGIYAFMLATETNGVPQNIALISLGLAAETTNPSFLELDRKRRLLFAVNEMNSFEGKPTGAVSSFSIDPVTGKLALINRVSSQGAGPCHLRLDKTGKNLFVANYDSGSVALLRVGPDGSLGKATDFVQNAGKSINPDRQQGPHAHCVAVDPANKFALVCDLGLDKVFSYHFDADNGKLTPSNPAFAPVKPGAGPRHIEFRPDGKFAYVINELNSTVTVFAFDSNTGGLNEVQTVSTLPDHFDGPNRASMLGIHPNGRFLYASNRGNDTVALFEIDREKGTLEWVEGQNTGGKTPRHFGIQPSGKNLLIAYQNSNRILACGLDAMNGRLKPSTFLAESPSPVCVVFLPPEIE